MSSDTPPTISLLLHVTAQALIEHAERRAAGMGCAPHEAVGARQFAALAAVLAGEKTPVADGDSARLPGHIVSALGLIGDYCEQAGYGSCVVVPGGGAVLNQRNILDELLEAWGEVERLRRVVEGQGQALGLHNLEVGQ